MGVLSGLSDFLFGSDPISDANARQQEALLQQQAAGYAGRESNDYARQLQYGQMLIDQIRGVGAPSVAQRQLQSGLDTINRGAQSQVAGAAGSNGALAGYGAMLNVGNLGAQANQQGAVLRAQETQSAQNQLGGLYANMGARSAANYGTAVGGGENYAALATSIQQANQRAQQAATGTLLSTAGTLGAAAFGGPPAAAVVAPGAQNYGQAYSAAQPGYAASQTAGPAAYVTTGAPTGGSAYGPMLTATDQPADPYQAGSANYGNGLYAPYRSSSPSVGMR